MLYLYSFDWTLFLSALISSTLFPGGSEALLIYRLSEEEANVFGLILAATLGNVLGSIITYMMGRFGMQLGHRWFHISADKTRKAEQYFNRFGKWSLCFAWLPIIGDPICLVAGGLRYHIGWFIALVSLGKLTRYTLLAWAVL